VHIACGTIAARSTLTSVAPRVTLLTVRAFTPGAATAEATTFNIIKGLEWAAENGAHIVNMSFAGPNDPRMRDALGKAARKGMVLIAAAGNAGPKSGPQFPAADPNVIAVTATDPEDTVFAGANRGNHIAVAAPGVDILVPAPEGTYQFTTGTSVAAAEVSGVAALLMERNPSLTPELVRSILMRTAKDLGAPRARSRLRRGPRRCARGGACGAAEVIGALSLRLVFGPVASGLGSAESVATKAVRSYDTVRN
jgi:subtilisin family serine protease